MKYIVPFFMLFVLQGYAQDNALKPSEEKSKARQVLLLPFQPTCYMSDIDKKISESSSNCNFDYIVNTFRAQLDIYLANELKQLYVSHKYTGDPSAENLKQLNDAYNAFKYQFTPVENTVLKEKGDKNTPIKGGQIVVKQNTTPEFMNATVADKEQFSKLCRIYNSDYFILVNQFEVVQDYYSSEVNSRQIKVHYAIVNRQGENIKGGIASASFSSNTSNIQEIIKATFPAIAKTVSASVVNESVLKK